MFLRTPPRHTYPIDGRYTFATTATMSTQAGDKYTITLPKLSAAGISKGDEPCRDSVQAFFDKLNSALDAADINGLGKLFRKDAWLRDMLALSWDFRTIHGVDKILKYFADNIKRAGLRNVRPRSAGAYTPSVKQQAPDVEWVETIVDFETKVGRGSGIIRIVSDPDGENRIFLMSLAVQELKGYEEKIKLRRPNEGNNSLSGGTKSGNWQERRDREKDFLDKDPTVIVIGAGKYPRRCAWDISSEYSHRSGWTRYWSTTRPT